MKQFLIRDKFKGDEKKQILLNFLLKEDRTWDEIDDFIMAQWG